ncbi:hypothetical protein SAMN02745216_03061 [Desulfatibacillum alkenivorans DSM 16219]|jgi:hypothetical protein|uniref:Uncharacterized protein n=1 Tax=Desulfatibacillum alkenivorans DSM 16219 TaxID=1121393 RepID=A0A1M6QKK6_9BACT|nr:hypothetical protein [Desulfatibacillum alkenivorans]SHK20756.1 hypothetical protein SAMN02745216_03061 [Desulfatibacillum alkenivorans DSM 16219]
MSGPTQINVRYDPAEDRLLLRMNASTPEGAAEYRLWLTRRFVQLMWQGLEKAMKADQEFDPAVQPSQQEAVRQFKEEAALSSADFSTPYRNEEKTVMPLGENPVLITKMQIKRAEDGKKVLIMQGEEGPAVTLALAENMLHSVRKLIADAADRAGWGLSLKLLSQADVTPPAEPRMMN